MVFCRDCHVDEINRLNSKNEEFEIVVNAAKLFQEYVGASCEHDDDKEFFKSCERCQLSVSLRTKIEALDK